MDRAQGSGAGGGGGAGVGAGGSAVAVGAAVALTAALDFVPYVGLAVSLIVASIVALFSGGAVGTKVLVVVIMYLSQKIFEAAVLGPKILGSHVGVHPVLLILSLLVFGYFMGFLGLLIAVPLTALLLAGVKEWEAVRKRAPAEE